MHPKNRSARAVLCLAAIAIVSSACAQKKSSGEDGGSGWTDLRQFLVPSDGTHSVGDNGPYWDDANKEYRINSTRDQGSKIVYFDPDAGDNATASAYWLNGTHLVDQDGSTTNPDNGQEYGTDPLDPNLQAIRPFKQAIGMADNEPGDPRLRTNFYGFGAVAGAYPDWFLFRRGKSHQTFDGFLTGGRSESAPMVIAAYGPLSDGRAIIAPVEDQTVTYGDRQNQTRNPFVTFIPHSPVWLHLVMSGLDVRTTWSIVGAEDAESRSGGPVTALFEDCAWIHGSPSEGGNSIVYLPRKTTVRRSVVGFVWQGDTNGNVPHSQGYYNSGSKVSNTFDEVIFYRNGYQTDPRTDPDPVRDIYSRNIYAGGGAQMGNTYRNIISADGGSGGPQMRMGGLCENSLIVEGYWYSGTNSNEPVNEWLPAQKGQTAVVRNNVQLVFAYPTPGDPDSHIDHPLSAPYLPYSDVRSHPGGGYTLQAASFGAVVEGNIISRAMLDLDLQSEQAWGEGLHFAPFIEQYQDGNTYYMKNNIFRNNIVYRMPAGLKIEKDWTGSANNVVEGNVFAAKSPFDDDFITKAPIASELTVKNNRFYTDDALPIDLAWIGEGNTQAPRDSAAATENWPDPDRTLKRYVTEVLGLTLLDWDDDPYLESTDVGAYDPTGLKTFMAVATNMRHGGQDPIPASGKPSWTGDYPWDKRFTGKAVVNWIREGFALAPVP